MKRGGKTPKDLLALEIPGGKFATFLAKGKIPDCITDTWKKIWESNTKRAYRTDFEVFGEKSSDWNNAEIVINISI